MWRIALRPSSSASTKSPEDDAVVGFLKRVAKRPGSSKSDAANRGAASDEVRAMAPPRRNVRRDKDELMGAPPVASVFHSNCRPMDACADAV
jgi:hypothetical protein